MTVRCHTLQGSATLIHSPNHYLSAIGAAIVSAATHLPAGFVERSPGVIVHETAVIHPTARLTGPVWIDAGVTVAEYAVIAGPVVLAPKSRVGGHALVHRSVAMTGSIVGVAAEIFSAILAPYTVRSAQTGKRLSQGGRQIKPDSSRTAQPTAGRMGRFLNLFSKNSKNPQSPALAPQH